MSNNTYDVLKYIAQVVLPALGTLYFALAGIWNLPYAKQVVGTISAIDAFLGVILKVSSNRYYGKHQSLNWAEKGESENVNER